ncbi:MAG: galactokinase [Bacilli bacterium]
MADIPQSGARADAVADMLRRGWRQFAAFSPGFAMDVRVFFAPGRVNLIGEHIDYNGGHVLPAALKEGTWVFARARSDRMARFASFNYPKVVATSIDGLAYRAEDDYANYPKGVIWAALCDQMPFVGADFLFVGNLPGRAGLSSSASIEMATALAVAALSDSTRARLQLVKLAQRAENAFVGVHCGIMDQFAVGMGQAGQALLLDTATLDYEPVPFPAGDYRLVIVNTNKQRGLADSRYNERRAECEAVLAAVQRRMPAVRHLAELSIGEWERCANDVESPAGQKRGRHVVTENKRVIEAAAALRAGRLSLFGELMRQSHESLRDDYEVTGYELDTLAEAAWDVPGCIGARMTGAGFGGCTVNFVHADALMRFQDEVGRRYRAVTGLTAAFYVSEIGAGAREVTEEARA